MPRLVSSGPLSGADDFHYAEGTAQLIETTPGVYVLRLEEFSVRNGPDLFVYLTAAPNEIIDSDIKWQGRTSFVDHGLSVFDTGTSVNGRFGRTARDRSDHRPCVARHVLS